MQRIDLMTYSGVMQEWKRRSSRSPYTFDKGVLPQDKSWQVYLLAAGVIGTFAVLFVRWWLCA